MNKIEILTQLMLSRTEVFTRLLSEIVTWGVEQRREFLQCARDEKCFPNAAALFAAANILDQQGLNELQIARLRYQCSQDLTTRLPSNLLLLKGAALERYYPEGVVRDLFDIDLMVSDADAMLQLANMVRDNGYELAHTMLWSINQKNLRELTGSVRFRSKVKDLSNVEVEVHFGAFPTSLCTGITTEEFLQFADRDHGLPTTAISLTPTGQLCLILADYAIRTSTPVTVRHIADIMFLFNSCGAEIDLPFIINFVQRHAICNSIAMLRNKLLDCGITQFHPKLAQLVDNKILLRAAKADRSHYRRALFAPLASGLVRWRTLIRVALFEYRNVTLWARKKRFLRLLLKLSDQNWLTLKLAGIGMRMAMTPISRRGDTVFTLKKIDEHIFYVMPMGTFHMSQHGILSEEEKYSMFIALSQIRS
jgi:hypothetical protein